jgi:predicted phage-related endonuclease
MAVTGLHRCDFAVLLGGQQYFEDPVYRDEELEHDVLNALSAFWRCVELNLAPPVDGSQGYGRYLSTLVEVREKKAVEASPEMDVMVARWREVRAMVSQLAAEDSLIRNRLLAYATANRAKQIRSTHGTIPIVDSTSTTRGWEALARQYAKQIGDANADTDIEPHTRRRPYAFARAPGTWGKE